MFVPLCSVRARHGGTKIVDFAKTSIFVQTCSVRARREMNKNGENPPFLFQAISGAHAPGETNIANWSKNRLIKKLPSDVPDSFLG